MTEAGLLILIAILFVWIIFLTVGLICTIFRCGSMERIQERMHIEIVRMKE